MLGDPTPPLMVSAKLKKKTPLEAEGQVSNLHLLHPSSRLAPVLRKPLQRHRMHGECVLSLRHMFSSLCTSSRTHVWFKEVDEVVVSEYHGICRCVEALSSRLSLRSLSSSRDVRKSHPRHHAADDLPRLAASSHTRVLGKSHAVCARAFV